MGEKKVRISEELYEQLQKLAEKSGRSIRDLAEEAIKAYLLGTENIDKPVKAVTGKVIPLQYPSRCKFCGKEIKAGELAYWAKYAFNDNSTRSYVICLDCYYKDTALAEWYLKKKKMESVVRGLKKKADELVEQVEKLQLEYDVSKVKQEVIELWRSFKSVFLSDKDEIQRIGEFFDRLNEVLDRINEIESSLKIMFTEKPKRAKKVQKVFVRNEWE